MKEILARIVYLIVGYVLWVLVRYDRLTYTEDDSTTWEANWWIFSEYGDVQHGSCTRAIGGLSACRRGRYTLARWVGRRLHFAYRHSFRSGRGVRSFLKHYAIAYRLGL